MAIPRTLSNADALTLLYRHPEIELSSVPTWGYLVTDSFTGETRDYRVFVRNGQPIVFDQTAYYNGERIDPSITNQSTLGMIWDATYSGISETLSKDLNPFYFGSIANIALIIFVIYAAWRIGIIPKKVLA